MNLLAEGAASFGTGEAALTASFLLALLIGLLSWFGKNEIKKREDLEKKTQQQETQLALVSENKAECQALASRVQVMETQWAVAKAERINERVTHLEEDMREMKTDVKWLRLWAERVEGSGRFPIPKGGRYHSRHDDQKDEGEKRDHDHRA